MRRLLNVLKMFCWVAVIVTACSVATKKTPDSIIFSHHLHSEQGLGCDDCHAPLLAPASTTAHPIPAKQLCADCHEIDEERSCGTCHRNTKEPSTWTGRGPSHLIFSHKDHVDNGSECQDCHEGAAHWPDRQGKAQKGPEHPDCASCHQKELDAGKCKMCHERLDLNSEKPEQIFSHKPGFFKRHGLKAEGSEDMCAQCHDQSFCADCHAKTMTIKPSYRYPEQVDREFMHRGDWISKHPQKARMGDTGCLKCHGSSFCSSCHERSGIGGHLGRVSTHPADWASATGATSHGRAARRRISECASCHDQGPASVCVHCHRSGGIKPHPPGWDPPVPVTERASHEMCRICHSN